MNRRARRSRDGRLAAVSAAARGDRGASAVELAILAPALLVLTMIVIQFALWFQAREAALAAAQEGAQKARVLSVPAADDPGWKQQVHDFTLSYYNGLGTHILTIGNPFPMAFADPNTGMAGVTVSGKVNSLLNMFGGITVTVTVQGPQECFHPDHPVAGEGACG